MGEMREKQRRTGEAKKDAEESLRIVEEGGMMGNGEKGEFRKAKCYINCLQTT